MIVALLLLGNIVAVLVMSMSLFHCLCSGNVVLVNGYIPVVII